MPDNGAMDLAHLIKISVPPPPADVPADVRDAVVPLNPTAAVQLQIPGNRAPVRPGDSGYKSRIPPGAYDGTQDAPLPNLTPITAPPPAAAPAQPQQRLSIMFGRKGKYGIAVEVAPDWDFDGEVMQVTAKALRELYPILERVVKIKDQTGGAFKEDDDEPTPDA